MVNNISGTLVVGKVHEVLKYSQSLSPLNQPGFRNTGEEKKKSLVKYTNAGAFKL